MRALSAAAIAASAAIAAASSWPGQTQAATLSADSPMLNASTYLDLAFAGDRVVAVGDRGHIVYSDDQGESWLSAEVPTGAMLTAVCFADAGHGWAVGHDAVVLATSDGGVSWTVQHQDVLQAGAGDAGVGDDAEINYDDDIYNEDVYAQDSYSDDIYSDDIYAEDYGDEGAAATDNQGAPLLDVHCGSNGHVIAVGGFGYFLESTDAGSHWDKRTDALDNGDGWHLYGIASVPGSDTLLIAGEKGILFRSRDGGHSWKKLKSPYNGSLFGIAATETGVVATYGLQGNLFVSTDEGDRWRSLRTGVTRSVNDMTLMDDGSVILAGSGGVVLVSHDNLASVTLQYLAGRPTVSSLLSVSDDKVITAGDAGITVVREQIR